MKRIVAGILAHVDAGKTSLCEGLLYLCGMIRRLGRVDHGDAFLDTFALEKKRGITIFSKQALLSYGDVDITLLDTPGHVDFSAEMERTLQALDYAILLISGSEGIQSHTLTLLRLLSQYQVPTFLFFNKMDLPGADRDELLAEAGKRLGQGVVDFTDVFQRQDVDWERLNRFELTDGWEEDFLENVASCREDLMEAYLDKGEMPLGLVREAIACRDLFPCFFGSALKMTGIEAFLRGLSVLTRMPTYPEDFGARVFKIGRDDMGTRLTWLKITGGELRVKDLLEGSKGGETWQEKTDQVRIYSGAKYELAGTVLPGMVCAVSGLTHTFPGQGLGITPDERHPVLEPVLNYQVLVPSGCDVHLVLHVLKDLEEEDPQLHVAWDETLGQIHVMLMGEVQLQILKTLVWERAHAAVDFGQGNIVYKETILSPVIGVGHFEPLRHYAEVHLLLEPGEKGSGLSFFTACSEDILDRNWQRLILTHLMERDHKGVLTGASITDMQITLINGRAHLKHTEGGDFRQATYRAIRQGMKKARIQLLEPWYAFLLEVPAAMVGRAMTDVRRMGGIFETPDAQGDMAVLTGTAPVRQMQAYPAEVLSYTGGLGRCQLSLKGYEPCQDQEAVAQAIAYDSERDLENPTGSVFCSHGAGFLVPWDQVETYMHLKDNLVLPGLEDPQEEKARPGEPPKGGRADQGGRAALGSYEEEKELQAIFERTFGPVKSITPLERPRTFGTAGVEAPLRPRKEKVSEEEYLLVDGYNIIFAWEDLRDLAQDDIHAAQTKLMDILSNYQGIRGGQLILVFDAYKLQGHGEEILKYHNIHVVYTKEAETADMFIERTVHKLGRHNRVTVATSDGLEQVIIMGQGAQRLSAKGLYTEIQETLRQIRGDLRQNQGREGMTLMDQVSVETADLIEKLRLGREE